MEDKIKQIRELCIKANPSILYLEFGCEVKVPGVDGKKLIIDVHTTPSGTDWNYIVREEINESIFREVRKEEMEGLEIIGRPITLSDVFLAILEFDTKTPIENTGKLLGLVAVHWNNKDNSLENQSKQTINFIHNILWKN